MKPWSEITKEELTQLLSDENLSNRTISERYGVTMQQVRYKLKKFGIRMRNHRIEQFLSIDGPQINALQEYAKQTLLNPQNIDGIAKALTHHAFRNGPVEDMHANGQLSQEDMKTLNKFLVNRLAGVLTYAMEGKWIQLLTFYERTNQFYGSDWDPAEPDVEDIDALWRLEIKHIQDSLEEKRP